MRKRRRLGHGRRSILRPSAHRFPERAVSRDVGTEGLGSGKGGSVKRVQDLEQALLAEVPTDGKTIGNIALIRKLGWAEDAYWPVRDALIDRGELVRGGGRGGSVYRVIADVEEDDLDLGAVVPARRAGLAVEKDLYEPIRKVLKKSWAKDQRFLTNSIVKTIANGRQGAGGTGKWSQPDLLFLGLRNYELMGQRELNVVTFEVKRLGGWDIKSIYQAEAHKQNANYSYVFLHNEDDSGEREKDANSRGVDARLSSSRLGSSSPAIRVTTRPGILW